MQENLEEKISMLLDDELSTEEAISLLEQIDNNDVLKQVWHRYNMIRAGLISEDCVRADSRFRNRVKENISLDPAVFPAESSSFRYKKWAYALAASVVFVSVLSWYQLVSETDIAGEHFSEIETLDTLPLPDHYLDARLEDYLVTHNQTAPTGVQGMLPYGRVVSLSSER